MEKLTLKFLIINDNAELIEQRLKKILQENEQYSSIFDLKVKGIKGSEFDIDIRQEITFHYYDIIILGYSFITNEEYLSKHRFFEKIKSGEIIYKQKNPNWSVFDKDMLEIFYEKRKGIESIILKEDGGKLPPSKEQVEELDLKPINKFIPPEEDGGNLPPKEEADRKAQEEARKAQEEADRKAQEEARKAQEEADRKAQEEARKAQEEARKAQEEARKAQEEADRKAQEEARKAKEEADRKAQEEARKAQEEARKAQEEARKAKEEARKAKEEADRKAKEEARKAQEEADRKAQEEARKAQEEPRKAQEEADRKAQEEADRKAKEEADRKAQEEADRKAKEEVDNGGNLPPLEEIGEFSEEEAKIFAIFQEEKNHKKEIPTKKIHQEKKEEEKEIKNDFSLTEEEILKILNPEKTVVETKISKPKEKPIIHEKRMAIDIDEEVGGNLPPTEENKILEESESTDKEGNSKERDLEFKIPPFLKIEELETATQEKDSKKIGLGIKIPKFPKKEKNGGKLPPKEEQLKNDKEESFYTEEEVLAEESSEKKKKSFTFPSFGLKNNSAKNGGKLPPREFKGDIGFFGNDRGVGTTFIAFTLAKVLSKSQTVAFIDMTERTYKKLETLKEKKMIDFDVYNSSNFIDAYRKNTDIKIFDFGEIDLNSESYFAEFERCSLKFLVGSEDDLKIFSMNKNYHYNEKNPDFYSVINYKDLFEERELQKEYQGLNIITIPFIQENVDDVLNLIR